MRCTIAILVAALLLLASASPAQAQDERILDFRDDVTVNADATLTVRETIRFRVTGDTIRHGINRDIPVDYGNWWSPKVAVNLQVQEVLLDGKPEPYTMEREGRDLRVRIGREDALVTPGEHTYTITYRVDRMLGFFKDHDELYWNVTGNAWTFAIDHASATVALPTGIGRDDIKAEAYTGAEGDKGKNYRASAEGGRATLETLEPMPVGHGLTIVVSWPKGFVVEPTRDERMRWAILDNLPAVVGLAGVLAVFLYYFFAWWMVGRDPPRGTIIPLFQPPRDLSPAAMRYILRMGYDTKCMAATLIDLAVRGYARIEKGDNYRLVQMGPKKETPLPLDEADVHEVIFDNATVVELENTDHTRFQNATKRLKKSLATQFKRRYFFSHLEFAIAGTVLSLLVLGGMLVTVPLAMSAAAGFLTLWLSGWSVGVYALVSQAIPKWRAVAAGEGAMERVGAVGGALFITLFAIPFVGAEIFVLGLLATMVSLWLAPVAIALIVLNIVFYHLLRAPTYDGRRVMDEIEGFRMYLATAEGDRLNTFKEPKKTPELFERYLPYALALNVENHWAEQFADVLAKAGQTAEGRGTTAAAYSPAWYSGPSHSTLGTAAFAGALGAALASAFSSASSAPGSSSGGGGGGSSGGGGGGGGGSGW